MKKSNKEENYEANLLVAGVFLMIPLFFFTVEIYYWFYDFEHIRFIIDIINNFVGFIEKEPLEMDLTSFLFNRVQMTFTYLIAILIYLIVINTILKILSIVFNFFVQNSVKKQ